MDNIGLLEREAANTLIHGVWGKGSPVFSKLSDNAINAIEARPIASSGDAATSFLPLNPRREMKLRAPPRSPVSAIGSTPAPTR
jgi:hypothetical protein